MKYRLHKKSLINKIYNCFKSNFLRKVKILMFVQFIKYFIIQIMHKFNEIKYEIEKRINENKSNTKEEWEKYLKEILKILEDK